MLLIDAGSANEAYADEMIVRTQPIIKLALRDNITARAVANIPGTGKGRTA